MNQTNSRRLPLCRTSSARLGLQAGCALSALALLLGGCAQEAPFVRSSLEKVARNKVDTPTEYSAGSVDQSSRATSFYQTPKASAAIKSAGMKPPQPPAKRADDDLVATLNLENMPLPQFVNAIFGGILKLNVSMDSAVAQRTEMISLRSGTAQSADQIFAAGQAVLRSYGVAVQEYNGMVRVMPENGPAGALPEIMRGRAQPDVPQGLRPVFYLAELQNTNVSQAMTWLRTLFQNKVTATEDNSRNSIMLSGQSDSVAAALEALQLLDQPLMRGRVSARVVPVFWSSDEMAKRLVEMLSAEGYAASTTATNPAPILILPVAALNSIVVFAADQQVLNHVLHWAQELDQSPPGRGGGYIIYHVRNTDATDLANTLKAVMGESSGVVASATAAGTTGGAAAAPAQSASSGGKVVVDKQGNSLIIKTTPAEYQQWYGLLQELDRPTRTALIMATVAELDIDKTQTLGFNWLLKQFTTSGFQVDTGTTASPGTSSSVGAGFRVALARGGDPRALFTAISTNNRSRVLANPSIMTRNGETATIQVGDEVPILTSQTSTTTAASSTSTGVVQTQTVQYRSTGTILKVKPVIHSGGRVEIDVSQEVSSVKNAATGAAISSPTVSTRKIDTKLTVSEGNTILLGGLIKTTGEKNIAGVPLLKDIPYLGSLFRTEDKDNEYRTELIVMLTPYIVEDDFDARAVTDAFRNQFSWAKEMTSPIVGKDAASSRKDVPQGEPQTMQDVPSQKAGGGETVADSPSSVTESAGARAYRSKPYALPDADTAVTNPPAIVAPVQQSGASEPAVSAPVSSGSASSVVDSDTVKSSRGIEGETHPVADEALKQELLKAIQGSGSVK